MKILGHLVDIHKRDIYPAEIVVSGGLISKVERIDNAPDVLIMPGLIDAHIHIESSMVTPGAFAMAAVKHGTIGVVSDPHEIANVLGIEGVNFMIDDAKKVPLYFWFGAPSCVPATGFETSGAVLTKKEVGKLLDMPGIKYLSEMMNFPGVINDVKEVMNKLRLAENAGKPVDGHAPGLTGDDLIKYVSSGISTDHECSSLEEAEEKIALGMKILIREGSAARNLMALKNIFKTNPEMLMLCSDDLHPEMLNKRHINKLVVGLISEGFNVFDVIRSVTINPVNHYNLEAGLLREGNNADFILVNSLKEMNVLETWIGGKRVFADEKVMFSYKPGRIINNFNCEKIIESDVHIRNQNKNFRVIKAFDGQLTTKQIIAKATNKKYIEPDINKDILKIIVKDRYKDSQIVVGFVNGFGLKRGAFASSIAHDSHNIICVGTNDSDIVSAVNEIVKLKGGLAVSSDGKINSLQLNIGGIMTNRLCDDVASEYEILSDQVKLLGCKMKAPFMALSFMALLVIPELKIGDRGLFDVNKFELVSLFLD
jgi:adenine deaminase